MDKAQYKLIKNEILGLNERINTLILENKQLKNELVNTRIGNSRSWDIIVSENNCFIAKIEELLCLTSSIDFISSITIKYILQAALKGKH